MKFAVQLSENLVPEWRDQYLDYKGGKKRLKKIGKKIGKSPPPDNSGAFSSLLGFSAGAKERAQSIVPPVPARVAETPLTSGPGNTDTISSFHFPNEIARVSLPPPATSATAGPSTLGPCDTTDNTNDLSKKDKKVDYGSTNGEQINFNPTSSLPMKRLTRQSSRPLDQDLDKISEHSPLLSSSSLKPRPLQHAYTEMPAVSPIKRQFSLRNIVNKFSGFGSTGSTLNAYTDPNSNINGDGTAPQFDTMYTADEQDFIDWLNDEFNKIETFFKKKEDDCVERYLILQDQLFNLREQKYVQKVYQEKKQAKALEAMNRNPQKLETVALSATKNLAKDFKYRLNRKFDLPSLPDPIHQKLFGKKVDDDDEVLKCIHSQNQKDLNNYVATAGASTGPSGCNQHLTDSASVESSNNVNEPSSSHITNESAAGGPYPRTQSFSSRQGAPDVVKVVNENDIQKPKELSSMSKVHSKDYAKRIRDQRISYGVARRQLKLAVVELYRELEMLKSYRSLNLTALRKMIKKFDKVTGHNAQPGYMAKVKTSYFSQSELLDDLIRKTEDMFAVYFENGNHKHAVEKLRANTIDEDHYTAMFLTGICLGLAVPIAIRATVKGISDMHEGDPDALFLFQIWGGFFFIVLFLCLFAVNCSVWTIYKVNYPFIFEFNPLDHLDAKQVGAVPSFLFFVLSLVAWLCFEDFWPKKLPQIYYPVIYLVFMLSILFWPTPGFYHNARKWLYVAMWRVFCSGLYPVEFRDLIMGDISCSLTYTISNTAFFFCLYATHWSGLFPGSTSGSHCGSSHSRWMGFLSALPGIWRFLQCGRRYLDSGDAFPHVANMGKYSVQIASNAFLSAYRINLSSTPYRTLFILFASLNTIYSGFWDLFMDWSVMQFTSKNFLLRDELAFKSTIPYYVAMILDLLLRCNWVFYAIYANQVQQSAKVSFFVALAELLRRFLWVFFRVENEHCSNVLRFRASRDITLPYVVVRRKQAVEDGAGKTTSNAADSQEATSGEPGIKPPLDEEARIGHDEHTGTAVTAPSSNVNQNVTQESLIANQHQPFRTRLYRVVSSGLKAVGHTLQAAHVRDFERRKDKPKPSSEVSSIESDDEEDDDEEDDEYYNDTVRITATNRSGSQYPSISIFQNAEAESNHVRHRSNIETDDARQWRDAYL